MLQCISGDFAILQCITLHQNLPLIQHLTNLISQQILMVLPKLKMLNLSVPCWQRLREISAWIITCLCHDINHFRFGSHGRIISVSAHGRNVFFLVKVSCSVCPTYGTVTFFTTPYIIVCL